MVRIIAEVGSTHMGKLEYAIEAVDRCAELGIDAIKFQLFPHEKKYTASGNIPLRGEDFVEIFNYSKDLGISCSASVFDENSFEFLMSFHPDFIKFAYSKNKESRWIDGVLNYQTIYPDRFAPSGLPAINYNYSCEAIVSCDHMSFSQVPKRATKLFCLPFYPVYYQINWSGIFPKFDGFSDHTLGYEQTLDAVRAGAKTIEKHITLNHADITCPDSAFAINPAELSNLVAEIRNYERG